MKKETYVYPRSSFLSVEKDMNLIVNKFCENDNLKKMLYYTSTDCLNKPDLTEDQTLELFGKNIKIVPKLYVDGSVLNYVVISFDNFSRSLNPEFRNSVIEFDIVCHFDQWQIGDFQLRPYRIAAEIDSMINNQHLSGIGELEFISANEILLTDEFAGLCLTYRAYHGEEDKKHNENPLLEASQIENFNKIFNSDSFE